MQYIGQFFLNLKWAKSIYLALFLKEKFKTEKIINETLYGKNWKPLSVNVRQIFIEKT